VSDTAEDSVPAPGPAPAPLLPALAVRVEDLLAAVASLSSRIDGVAVMAQALQTSVTDRFVEFVETTTAATTAQAEALDEYRRATERSVGELRRAASTNDDLIRTLLARIDELTTDMRESIGGAPAAGPAEVDLEAISAVVADALSPAIEALSSRPEPASADARQPRSDGKVTEELVNIREQMTELKRRVGVRARAKATLDDAEVDRLAEVIVDRLTDMLEVVPDDEGAPVASTVPTPPAPVPAPADPPAPTPGPRRGRRARG
jgi:hypothetical protein